MNADRLLAHYEQIADAPDAIARLRRFILDLAVRGKLVPQDPDDEPASELLKRIAAEKARLVKAGLIKPVNPLRMLKGAHLLVPTNWKLLPLGDIVNGHLGGGTPSKSNASFWDGDIRWASVKDVGKQKYLDETIDRITEDGLANSSSNLIPAGNLIVVTRMGLGQLSINRVPVAINQDLRALFLPQFVNIDYVYNFFLTYGMQGTGLTVKGIKIEELLGIPFPLPPLAEQHRIVAKVDELMALCDQLEAARTEREASRDRLAAASLARLNTPAPETFEEDARFALDALPALTARADQIQRLRQTILNLAVRGKLVPQDPSDEPAASELRKVDRLKAELNLKKPKKLAQIKEEEKWCLTPKGWIWARWDQITDWITYGFTRPMEHGDKGIPIVTGKNVNQGRILFDTASLTPTRLFNDLNEKDKPQPGDILITKDGSIGRTAIVEEHHLPFCINQSVAVMWLRCCHFNRRFLKLVLDSPQTQEFLLEKTAGVAIKHISITDLGKMVFPLPPLAEQDRIVAKVDELMALCDQLEASLTNATNTRSRLLNALLVDALTPLETHDLEVVE